ncbi:polyprenyl synthetase family protein [Oxalobacter vibrioformis]|uniref:Octaprenyl diphosphate synthase n=1 Tax=Oxalobacter vibrioformis TaxID=933080 RepID=A0A9E9M2E2_9BURK|nr:polyprenyl synthetase family protein [Oxalobacter vibrioformis]WAW11213.1 polyprenyl synthetase family protein [Oxalobacter vibrioformis]
MSQPVLSESDTNPSVVFPDLIMADLAALDILIHEQLRSDAVLVRHVGEHIINAGGKRIRPLLVLLIARALGHGGGHHHTMAAIIEFIHTASLLHDDVVDESRLRRGVESANTRFGNAAAVLVGDFMHTRAFQMMLSLNNMKVMEILADATNTIAEGEVMQLMKMRQSDVDEEQYFTIIHAKTAKLFEAASLLGVVAASGSDRFHTAASTYGRSLGMAFQLVDDCLDYAGDTAMLGKNTGNDLRESKMTLPLIYLAQHGTADEKRLITEYIENGVDAHFEAIMHAVRQSDALEYTSQKAAAQATAASRAIGLFPDNDYKNTLTQLCRFAVERKY